MFIEFNVHNAYSWAFSEALTHFSSVHHEVKVCYATQILLPFD